MSRNEPNPRPRRAETNSSIEPGNRPTGPLPRPRPLRGPSRYFAEYGVVLSLPEAEQEELEAWLDRVARMRSRLGWLGGPLVARREADGIALALEAPADQLEVAGALGAWAWLAGREGRPPPADPARRAGGKAAPDGDEQAAVENLKAMASRHHHEPLQAVLDAARLRGLPTVFGERRLCIGYGEGSCSWPLDALPDALAVPWAELHPVPVALIAGSDRCVELLGAMLRAQGWHSGELRGGAALVDGAPIDAPDDDALAATRRLLRDRAVQAAAIRVDREWYGEQGVPVTQARVALVEAGGDNAAIAESIEVLPRTLESEGMLVLDADDPAQGSDLQPPDCTRAWYAQDFDHPLLVSHRESGGATCGWRGDRLLLGHVPQQWCLGRRSIGGGRGTGERCAPAVALTAHAMGVGAEAIELVLARPLPARR